MAAEQPGLPWRSTTSVLIRNGAAGDASRAAFLSASAIRTFVLIAVIIGLGLLAVAFGQSNGWDLRNYHLYDGWAFWTGRGQRDFAAAQMQTYFNPLLATGTYLLFMHLAPWLSTFVLGIVHATNVVPLYLLARRFLPTPRTAGVDWMPLVVAMAGAVGATQLGELGGSIGDNLVSIPVLWAFALAFGATPLALPRAAGSAVLIGVAAGIKLTAAPFALGLVIAMPFLGRDSAARLRLLLVAGTAALAGFVATDGFWMLRMYQQFGNPLFPQFSDFFAGAYAPSVPMADHRSLPRNLLQWLFYPLIWLPSPRLVSNAWFFDLRVPLAFLAAPLIVWRSRNQAERRPVLVLVVALTVAYLAWLPLFGVYRYLAPIEMLAPLLIVVALADPSQPRTGIAAKLLLTATVVLIRPPGWGHAHPYGESFLETTLPAFPDLDRATIVFAEDEPLSFLALEFPPGATFVRIAGNLLGPPFPAYAMDRDASRRLAAANAPLYALLANPESAQVRAAMARQGMLFGGPCEPIRSNLIRGNHRAELCPLRRDPSRVNLAQSP